MKIEQLIFLMTGTTAGYLMNGNINSFLAFALGLAIGQVCYLLIKFVLKKHFKRTKQISQIVINVRK